MTPEQMHAAIKARLETLIPTDLAAVYSGRVPDDPPALADGRVKPYAVLWGSPGSSNPGAEDLCGEVDGAYLAVPRVTVAAGDPDWCLAATTAARDSLSRWQPAPEAERLRDDGFDPAMLEDEDVNPRRWFTPLQFRTAA